MIVKIRSKEIRLFLPVPAVLAGWVVTVLPDKVFEELQANTPEPYRGLVSKEMIGMLLRECRVVIKENKGLEIIHVEAQDGTFVSVKL